MVSSPNQTPTLQRLGNQATGAQSESGIRGRRKTLVLMGGSNNARTGTSPRPCRCEVKGQGCGQIVMLGYTNKLNWIRRLDTYNMLNEVPG